MTEPPTARPIELTGRDGGLNTDHFRVNFKPGPVNTMGASSTQVLGQIGRKFQTLIHTQHSALIGAGRWADCDYGMPGSRSPTSSSAEKSARADILVASLETHPRLTCPT